MSEYIQIGVTALRDPKTGEILPSVPLFIKREDAAGVPAIQIGPIAKDLGDKFAEYMKGLNRAGLRPE